MIDASLVSNAVLAHLQADWPDVGDGMKPEGATGAYGVLEFPGGSASLGDMDSPESDLVYRCRVRSVGGDRQFPATPAAAREQTELLAFRLRRRMLDRDTPIVGVDDQQQTWKVTSREWVASGGVDIQGTVANVVDDFELWVVKADSE